MFGDRYSNNRNWEIKQISQVLTFHNGKAHEQVIDEKGQYILVTSKCISSEGTDIRRTNKDLYPLHTNDIVMVMSDLPNGKALGKCMLIDEENKYTLNQRICCFDNYKFNPTFLLHLLNRHEYFLSFDNGNGQTNLRKEQIFQCPLIVPPLDLQNKFADIVKLTDKLKFRETITKLKNLCYNIFNIIQSKNLSEVKK